MQHPNARNSNRAARLAWAALLLQAFLLRGNPVAAQGYLISFVREVQVTDGDTVMNNFVGVFPSARDTTAIYQLSEEGIQHRWSFHFARRGDSVAVMRVVRDEDVADSIRLSFSGASVFVEKDEYILDAGYAKRLRRAILDSGSVLALARLLRQEFGDYAETLNSLQKTWVEPTGTLEEKILAARIVNRNYQTDTAHLRWTAAYHYNAQREVRRIDGGYVYNLRLLSADRRATRVKITRAYDRSAEETYLSTNKRTGFNSASTEWLQLPTNRTIHLDRYQQSLRTFRTARRPTDAQIIEQFRNSKPNRKR